METVSDEYNNEHKGRQITLGAITKKAFIKTFFTCGHFQHGVCYGLVSGWYIIISLEGSYFSTKTYVVGTQKNCLNEIAILSTQNKC